MNKIPIKKCRVCGDNATAFNYNGLTCEPCKVFFRRNATDREFLQCRQATDECKVDDIASRKSCTKCRLEKCFSIGMKIKSRNDKYTTHKNRAKLMLTNYTQNTEQSLVHQHKSLQPNTPPNFTEFEFSLTKEIQNSVRSSFADENKLLVSGPFEFDIRRVLNMPANYARSIVKFCKQIQTFKSMKQDDQFALVKPFYFDICTIRLVFLYDKKRDGFPILSDESGKKAIFVDFKIFNNVLKHSNKENSVRNYYRMFNQEIENDIILRDLIIAQLLFKPRDDMSSQEFINYQYYIYSRLLYRYLQLKYNDTSKANEKYCILMKLQCKLNLMKENLRRATMKYPGVEEVLTEVLEIKS